MYSTPNLMIFVPKGDGAYLIQRYRENPEFGYCYATGDFIEMTRKAMVDSGGEVVSQLLVEYSEQRDLGRSAESKMSAVECRWFHKQHVSVGLNMVAKDILEFTLIEMDETGRAGSERNEQTVMIPVPFTAQQFVDALDAASLPGQAQRLGATDDSGRERVIEQLLSNYPLEQLPITLVSIYVPQGDGYYFLQRHTQKPGLGNRATNEFVRMSRAEMESNASRIVTDLMTACLDRGPLQFKELSQEAVQMLREYIHVSLSLLPNLKVRFDVLGEDQEDDFVTISVPFTPQELIESLDAAVRQA